ncbi:MAG: hypothetical protein QG635_906 [Bacteroidota bacterium]|nr:hypothetical protein [Bacteroidota bacterium]
METVKEELTYDNILEMFKETDKRFQETDRQFKETREILDTKFQETDRQFKETDRKFQETDRQMRNLMKKMDEAEHRWGKFVESLVEGELIKLLDKRKIKVHRTSMREKVIYDDRQFEIDIIAKNGKEIVAVEVKTTLNVSKVKEFLYVLRHFREAFPEYSGMKIYGAIAYISVDNSADVFAEKSGLFVIRATGESAKITNADTFKPKEW